jgi:hypothetical protein
MVLCCWIKALFFRLRKSGGASGSADACLGESQRHPAKIAMHKRMGSGIARRYTKSISFDRGSGSAGRVRYIHSLLVPIRIAPALTPK